MAMATGAAERGNDACAELFLDCTHDLIAPFNQVSVLIALLIRNNEAVLAGPDSREILENIETSVKRMRSMAEGLRKLTRLLSEPLSVVPVETADLLLCAIRNCHRRLEPGPFEFAAGTLPVVRADIARLLFVFEELLENAIKSRTQEPLRIEIGASAGPGKWIFWVRDNGRGFDGRWSKEVFRVFRRLEPGTAGGSGVGLTICRRIVELHRGEMWAESEPARGTTLFFTLPA